MNDINNSDVSAQIKKIAEHLVFLEKKLDTLLEQSQNQNRRPVNAGFGGDRPNRPSFGGDRPNRGYRPNNRGQGQGYPPRHTGHSSHDSSSRYQGNRGPRPESNGNRADHGSTGGYQKKFTPHRGTR